MAAKILLVEDSDTQLKFLRDGLVANGFEAEKATRKFLNMFRTSLCLIL